LAVINKGYGKLTVETPTPNSKNAWAYAISCIMFIGKNYTVTHSLLRVLFEHDQSVDKAIEDLLGRSIHFNTICERLPKWDRRLLLDNLDYLRSVKEIYCSDQFDNSTFLIYSSGSHSYRAKKYLREGMKDQMNYIYDIAKTISVIILLAIAVWTFAQNIWQTKENKDDIKQLRQQLQEIKMHNKDTFPASIK
jgi:hypothetical protein